MIKWRTEKVRPTYVPTFCVGLDGMCRVLLGRCCRLIEDAVSTIYRAFTFRSAVAPPPPRGCRLPVLVAVTRFRTGEHPLAIPSTYATPECGFRLKKKQTNINIPHQL